MLLWKPRPNRPQRTHRVLFLAAGQALIAINEDLEPNQVANELHWATVRGQVVSILSVLGRLAALGVSLVAEAVVLPPDGHARTVCDILIALVRGPALWQFWVSLPEGGLRDVLNTWGGATMRTACSHSRPCQLHWPRWVTRRAETQAKQLGAARGRQLLPTSAPRW